MAIQQLYPTIRRACLEIAYDNGGVNRERPQKKVRKEISEFLGKWPYEQFLPDIEGWLASLPADQFSTFCTGDHADIQQMIEAAPPYAHSLLEDYFNEVC